MIDSADNQKITAQPDRLLQRREQILKALYVSGVIAGLFMIIPLFLYLHSIQHWPLFVFGSMVLAWGVCGLLFWRRLSFLVKVAGALGAFFLTGAFVVWDLGPFSGGGYWLFIFPICSAVLLGLRFGIIAVAIDAVVLLVFGLLVYNGMLSWGLTPQNLEHQWIMMSLSFVLLSLLAVVSISTLNKFLHNSLKINQEAKRDLEQDGKQLQKVINELQWEKAQRDQAQGELWAEKEMFRALSEESPLGLALCSREGRIEYLNNAFTKIFGYDESDVHSVDQWLEMVYPDPWERQRAETAWHKSIATGKVGSMPAGISKITCKDGSRKPILIRSVGLMSGERLALLEDFSERARSKEALRKSEDRYRSLVKKAPAGIVELDINSGTIVGVNDVSMQMIGFPYEEVIGRSPLELFPKELHPIIIQRFDELTSGLPVDDSLELYYAKRSDGEKVCLDLSFSSAGGEDGGNVITVVVNDITERKAAEQAVMESEKRFRQTADLLPVIIIECNHDLTLSYINRLGMESFGYREDELFGGLTVPDLVHPDLHEKLLQRVALMHTGQSVPSFEVLYLRKDGTQFYGLANCAPIINDKDVIGVRSAVLDITDSKHAMQALRDSETKYRTLFENINDLYCVHDLDGKLLDINPAAAKNFGIAPPELIGYEISEFMPDALKESFYSEYLAQIKSEGSSEGVLAIIGLDDTNHFLEYRNVLVDQQDGAPYVVAVGRDITERIRSKKELKRLQVQLQQSQKMEAVGTLAGGVAHDFNNILQAINGYAEVLHSSVEMDHRGKTHLGAISDAVERASNLVQQLLAFSRKVEPELVAVDINAEVRQTAAMLTRTIPKMIDIELELDKDVKLVHGDANQLGQVLLNLGANARDAMPDGGTLRISTSNFHAKEDFFDGNVMVAAGNYVLVGVVDNGVGMNKQETVHIFDPFFTTKPIGEGTGLGLSMVFGIVKGHKGYIVCESEKGQGTLFKVYLPSQSASEDGKHKQSKHHEMVDELAGVETVLLVDDEEPILQTLQTVVESYGYKTFTANNGESALEIAAEANGLIDLVILDLGMPGMGGLACMRKLHEIMPDLKVLIASGYSQHGPFETLLDEGAIGYIRKPFAIVDLMQKIRSVLGPIP